MRFIPIGEASIDNNACVMNVNIPAKLLLSNNVMRFAQRDMTEVYTATNPPYRAGRAKIYPYTINNIKIDLMAIDEDNEPIILEPPMFVNFIHYRQMLAGRYDQINIYPQETEAKFA